MKRKIYFIAFALLTALAMPSCNDENETIEDPKPYIELSPEKFIEFDTQGGPVTVTVDTNIEEWKVTISEQDWCSLVDGEDDGTFSIVAQPNENESREAEVCVIAEGSEFKYGSERPVKIMRFIMVSQKGTGVKDLSADGTSNCYIIDRGGDYSFDATVIGNGAAGIVDPDNFHTSDPAIAPVSAALLWQDSYDDGVGFITSVTLSDKGRVSFTASSKSHAANAVIAVYNVRGFIIWSWHIWMTSERIVAKPIETGYELMQMNLGASTSASANHGSFGMLYQWGRKDPFPSADRLMGDEFTLGKQLYDMEGGKVAITNSNYASSADNTLAYSIANPTICLTNRANKLEVPSSTDWLKSGTGVDALWGNPYGYEMDGENNYVNKGSKSIYDPCPVGWRVPPADVFSSFLFSFNNISWAESDDTVPDFNVFDLNGDGSLDINDYDHGWHFMLGGAQYSYFPAAARFDGDYAMLMGSVTGIWGSYWGNAPTNDGRGISILSFNSHNYAKQKEITLSTAAKGPRADGYSVRCVKE